MCDRQCCFSGGWDGLASAGAGSKPSINNGAIADDLANMKGSGPVMLPAATWIPFKRRLIVYSNADQCISFDPPPPV